MHGIDQIDLIAIAWFGICALGYHALTSIPVIRERSISAAVQRQRLAWMHGATSRPNHAGDAILHATLSQGNAFFTSTSALAIGGLASIVGSGQRAQAFLSDMPFAAPSSPLLWELKVLLLMGIFAFAFFKFAWAFRLTHYATIMIGAMPNPGTVSTEAAIRQANATATISGLAAEHSNAGLRSFYFAAAAMTWFLSPLAFIIATAWVLIILARRDFFSRSRRAILDAVGA